MSVFPAAPTARPGWFQMNALTHLARAVRRWPGRRSSHYGRGSFTVPLFSSFGAYQFDT